MKKKLIAVLLPMIVALGGFSGASAHECPGNDPNDPECHESTQAGDWRGNYIPLFDLAERDDESLSRAQRWRDECQGYNTDGTYENHQFCVWAEFGNSLVPNPSGELAPNEVHVGMAGTHCFLFETQHNCEDHYPYNGDDEYDPNVLHDAHGGAIYIDICLEPNPENKYCRNGREDTTIGITVMDHLECGLIVPGASCTDEYHVLKPFDFAYTEEQMADTYDWLMQAATDPKGFLTWYLCGFGPGSEDCIYPGI